jgi:hypothetical protein
MIRRYQRGLFQQDRPTAVISRIEIPQCSTSFRSELCYILYVGKAASPDSLWTRCPNETAQGHYARQI